jgi:hypothetical protein
VTIIYVHGVNVRDAEHGILLEQPFKRWLGPAIGGEVAYQPVYWGDIAAKFRWDLASRPKTELLQQGAGDDPARASRATVRLSAWEKYAERPPRPAGPVLNAPEDPSAPKSISLAKIPANERADFLSDLFLAIRYPGQIEDPLAERPRLAALAEAAQDAAAQWDEIVRRTPDSAQAAGQLLGVLEARLPADPLLRQGVLGDLATRAGESLKRVANLPFDAVSTVLAELRPKANEFVARFLGDVLTYMNAREVDGAPGAIPQRVLEAMRQAQQRKKSTGEPIVIVSHSMGGQLIYDALAYFAVKDRELAGLVVDHWFSCGAQVSFFAELGLLRGQPKPADNGKLPSPVNVNNWVNFYDPNDLVGFVMAKVFNGVADVKYDTGYGLALAHTGFLSRPSFFERMADHIKKGKS